MVETKIALALRSMECVAAKDLDGVMAFFTEDAVFFDPHYPKSRMQGHVEIADGIRWGFNGLKKLGFDVIETYESADGKSVVVSVRTAHVLPNGKPLNFFNCFFSSLKVNLSSRCRLMCSMSRMAWWE